MRIDKLLNERTANQPEPDFSILTDEELDFYLDTLTKAGYDVDINGNEIEGDLSLLSESEIHKVETLTQKTIEAGNYAN